MPPPKNMGAKAGPPAPSGAPAPPGAPSPPPAPLLAPGPPAKPVTIPEINMSHLQKCTCNSADINNAVQLLKNYPRISSPKELLSRMLGIVEEEYPRCVCNKNTTKELMMLDLLRTFEKVRVTYKDKPTPLGETDLAKFLMDELKRLTNSTGNSVNTEEPKAKELKAEEPEAKKPEAKEPEAEEPEAKKENLTTKSVGGRRYRTRRLKKKKAVL